MKRELLYSLPLALLLASCSQDDRAGSDMPGAAQGNLGISSVLTETGSGVQVETSTRADAEVLIPVTSGSIGVFRSQGTGYTSVLSNKEYAYSASDGWQPKTSADTIFLNGDDAGVYAYYPYDKTYTNGTAIPLTSHQYTGTAAKHDPLDICYALPQTANAYNRKVALKMKHAMAMLELAVYKDDVFASEEMKISDVSVSNSALVKTTTFNISGATVAYAAGTKAAVTYSLETDNDGGILLGVLDKTPDATLNITTSMLLVPFTPDSKGITVGLTVNGNSLETSITTAQLAKLEAGIRYRVKVKIIPPLMEVTGVDLMPWNETRVGGDDYVYLPEPEAPGPPGIRLSADEITLIANGCTEQDKTNLSKLIWAEGNLKSTGTNTSIKDYVWADTQEEYGYYYTWNSSYTGNNTSNGVDPCTLLKPDEYGTGWRTPTINEFEMLSRCTDQVLAVKNGVKGMWFMNNTKGLFLPAAGGRTNEYNGSGTTAPISGAYYWSKDEYDSNTGRYMTYYNGNVVTSDRNNKTRGFCVRCVKPVPPGIQLSPADINLGGTECDKKKMSKLIWAEGNLKSTGTDTSVKDYEWAPTQEDFGYYYKPHSSYAGDGAQPANGVDPCTLLKPDKYGTGWHTPSMDELDMLVRCTDKQVATKEGVKGIWFMNNQTGLFLPFAGYNNNGFATAPSYTNNFGIYWSNEPMPDHIPFVPQLYISDHSVETQDNSVDNDYTGQSVRCVKDATE